MPHSVSFQGLAIVAAVAFFTPLLLGLAPRLRVPSVVLEILAGVVLGPSVLGLVEVDAPIQILSLMGLAALLFLGGLEIELEHIKGRLLRLASLGFLLSLSLSVVVAFGLQAVGLVEAPLFLAIVLAATALGFVIPILKDSGHMSGEFGQLVVAGSSIADFGTVILLSLFFSREATNPLAQLLLLAGFAALAIAVVVCATRAGRSTRLSAVLLRLQHTTAQIRVRGAILLLVALTAFAERFGLETILAAFMAGAMLTLVDKDWAATHPDFRMKLEAIGFGVFVPVFFVASGLKFNLQALLASPAAIAQVPVYLVALLIVRGIPAWIYRPLIGSRRAVAAGLLQATNLGFIVAAVQIGSELRILDEATAAALMATAPLSVLVFPVAAEMVLRAEAGAPASH
ncbi:MAG: cation:proton antiporter [Vicinamibacteria bacterium]